MKVDFVDEVERWKNQVGSCRW